MMTDIAADFSVFDVFPWDPIIDVLTHMLVLHRCCHSSFLQNMMVVSSTAVKSIVGMNSGRDGHPCIISVIVKAINANCENESLVLSVCGLLANVALHKNGKIALSNAGTAKTLHGILKSSKHADIVQAAMSALYHLVSNNNLLNEDLIKDGYVATIIAAIHVFRNPGIANVSFGLLKELATLKEDMAKEVKNSGAITLAIDAIQNHSDIPELHGNVFSLLEITVSAENKQLHVKIAKRILESMQKHPEEEILQSDGCRVLASLQKNRALKTLLRTGFGKKILVLARSVFPDVCGGIIDQLLRD